MAASFSGANFVSNLQLSAFVAGQRCNASFEYAAAMGLECVGIGLRHAIICILLRGPATLRTLEIEFRINFIKFEGGNEIVFFNRVNKNCLVESLSKFSVVNFDIKQR